MHFKFSLFPTALLATSVLATTSFLSTRGVAGHGLMKRHFWCNGVDSDTICPEGETMVPIDQYACNAITSAGRLNQISPPANGETHTTCPGAPSSGTSTTPSSSPAAPPLVQVSPAPSLEESVTTNNNTTVPSDTKMQNQVMFGSKHYSCVEIDGGNDESG
ncbi:hypothetical protein MMC28_004240, partial [Mycoblastus sanguinarius]|nr:hypothetical protein [Mycoblastus sanguinarius]